LANYIETKVHEEYDSKKEGFATKEDIANLKTELKTDIVKLEIKIESSKVWLILTMITLFAISTGLIIHFVK